MTTNMASQSVVPMIAEPRRMIEKPAAQSPAGLDVETVRRLRAPFGLAVAACDERGLGNVDVEEGRPAREARALGFSEEQLLRLNRDFGMAAAQMAAAMLQAAAETVVRPGEDEHELGKRLAVAGAQLLPMAGSIASYAVQEHLRSQLSRGATSPAELPNGRTSGVHEVAVLFADLVGFTALGGSCGPEHLGDVAERFARVAAAAADPPVTLVKTLGDGAMFVAPEPRPLLAAADALLTTAQAEGSDFPPLRCGVAHGLALTRGGDWFGQPVNLAARICDVAEDGSILAAANVRDECPSACWTFAGTESLKGIPEPLQLWRLVSLPAA